jgi:uncharacterized membrane protein
MPMAYDGDSLPSPDELKEYEKSFPGLGRELIDMAREEQRHLQAMERRDYALSSRGQLFGFIIALAFLAAATFLIYTHHDTAGTIIGSTDLVALVAVFVVGRRTSTTGANNSIDSLIKELSKPPRSSGKRNKGKKNSPALPRPSGGEGTDNQLSAIQPSEPKPDKASGTNSTKTASITSVSEEKGTESPAEDDATPVKRKIIAGPLSDADRKLFEKLGLSQSVEE